MSIDNVPIALSALGGHLARHPLEFAIAEGDLVTVVAREHRGAGAIGYDFFSFHTVEIVAGEIVAQWANVATGPTRPSATLDERTLPLQHPTVATGVGDPDQNKQKVAAFYRIVFDGQNADAVADFVAEDYRQHSGHLPQGRAGLEDFVRTLFPDGPAQIPDSAASIPTVLMGEGDLVVIGAALPDPDGAGEGGVRMLYDAYRVRDGLITEHWSGVEPRTDPVISPLPGTTH